MCIDIELTSHDYIEFQVTFSNTVHGQDHMQQKLSPAPLPPPPPPPAGVSTSGAGRNAAGGLVGWKEGLYGHADLITIHTIYTDWRGLLTPFIFPSMLHCRRCGTMRWSSWTATGSAAARSKSTGMGHRHGRGRDTEAELR